MVTPLSCVALLLVTQTNEAPPPVIMPTAPPAHAAPEPAVPPTSPAMPRKTSVMILPIAARGGVSRDVAELITSALAIEAGRTPGFEVRSFRELEAAVSQEQLRQVAGCDAVSCAAELAGALDVDQIIVGNIGAVGDELLVTLTRVAARDSSVQGRAFYRAPSYAPKYFLDLLPFIVSDLFLLPRPPRNLPPIPPPPKKEEAAPGPTQTTVVHVQEGGSSLGGRILKGVGALGLAGTAVPFFAGVAGAMVSVIFFAVMFIQPSAFAGFPSRQYLMPAVYYLLVGVGGGSAVAFVGGLLLSVVLLGIGLIVG